MHRRTRLIFLFLSLAILLLIGRVVTQSFNFVITQFWFTSGLFLLITLSLIDQPNFSKDSNIFINSVTAWMSLILILPEDRDWIWWTFFSFTTYLIISSYSLIWLRKNELKQEHYLVALLSRINREIGKPEVIFSTFFIWGAVRQFGINTKQFDALLSYWIVFMILNMPAFASSLNKLFVKKENIFEEYGKIINIIDPGVAEVIIPVDFEDNLISKKVQIFSSDKSVVGEGVFIDERIISGSRIGKIVITDMHDNWKNIANNLGKDNSIKLVKKEEPIVEESETGEFKIENETPVSVVDKGTTIDGLIFFLNPSFKMQEGEITFVQNEDCNNVFYQVVAATITEELLSSGNSIQSVKVVASQLGLWDDSRKNFSPYSWVPPSGKLVYRGANIKIDTSSLSNEFSVVGKVPNSNFPVHVNLEDTVTHNTAVIGVTGSGKSYLAFHLIESLIAKGIRVMILDLTREHYQYLSKHNPCLLAASTDVKTWLEDDSASKLALHQFATATSLPLSTYQFTKAAFDVLSDCDLVAGKNLPAKLCIVFEEAHSLIPEWNQVSVQNDKDYVNNTARIILQGRKFGLGSLLITQRTANVTKTILNQCNSIFALQSFDQTGLEFLKNYMGDEYSGALSRLPRRRAILVGKSSSSQKPIIFEIDDYKNRWIGEEPVTPAIEENSDTQTF